MTQIGFKMQGVYDSQTLLNSIVCVMHHFPANSQFFLTFDKNFLLNPLNFVGLVTTFLSSEKPLTLALRKTTGCYFFCRDHDS